MNPTRREILAGAVLALPSLVPTARAAGPNYAVQIDDDMPAALHGELHTWVARSADAVTRYFGRFPAPAADITLAAAPGAGVRSGRTYDAPPPSIHVAVGTATTGAQFLADWILVHEMVHLGISRMPRTHNWFHEGVATYVEIIARARVGLTSREEAWGGLLANLHHGLPRAGEAGLDGTRRWGRTYWGGALFCLLADVQIRRGTGDRLGLQDALAGLVRAGSHYGERWPLARTLATADEGVGVPVLSQLYAQMKDQPVATDVPLLFRELGVRASTAGEPVVLLAEAPLASTRRAILPE